MKIKAILQLQLILLSFTSLVCCQTIENEASSKETITEQHYRIQVDPIETPDKPVTLYSNAEYSYKGGKLMEEKMTKYAFKEIESKAVYTYTDGKLTTKLTYLESSNKPMHEETFSYDASGEWQKCKTLNNGRVISLERLTTQDGKIEAEGIISNGKLKVYVDRTSGDSSIHFEINNNGKIIKQRQVYKINDYGHIVSEKMFSDEDKLISNKESDYSYGDQGKWNTKITNVSFVSYDGVSYAFRDSLVRNFESLKEKGLTKQMLIGNWHFENSNKNFISFQSDSKFYLTEDGQTNARGTWSLDSQHKLITLKFNAGDDKGQTIKWNYGYADESIFEVQVANEKKVFKKR